MSDLRITDLFETTLPQPGDYLPIVNTGTTKKVSIENLVRASQVAVLSSANLTATTSLSAPSLSGNHYGKFIGDGSSITNVPLNLPSNLTVTNSISAPSLSGTHYGKFIGDGSSIANVPLNLPANLTVTNSVSAPSLSGNHYGKFIGDGSSITNISTTLPANLTVTNSVSAPSLSGTFYGSLPVLRQDLTVSGNISASGSVTCGNVVSHLSASTALIYTIVPADNAATVSMSSSDINYVIIPSSITTRGFEVAIIQTGTGTTVISAAPGVTIRQNSNAFQIASQYSGASIIYINSTVGWVLLGDLV